MLRQALLRLTTQALLRCNLFLHPGDPSIEPEKGEIVWSESGDVGFPSGSIQRAPLESCLITCYSIVIGYTLHSTQYTKPNIKQPSNIIKPPWNAMKQRFSHRWTYQGLLMFGSTTGGWAPHKSAPASGEWGETKPITGPRETETDDIDPPAFRLYTPPPPPLHTFPSNVWEVGGDRRSRPAMERGVEKAYTIWFLVEWDMGGPALHQPQKCIQLGGKLLHHFMAS